MNEDAKVLLTLRRTRKSFLIEYFSGGILLLLLLIAMAKGVGIRSEYKFAVFGLALFAFAWAEWSRAQIWYHIMPKKIIMVHGLIKQIRKNVYYHPLGFVPDINLKQTRLQRLLNIGTIYVKAGEDMPLNIRDISNPHKVLLMIEELIKKNR